MAPVAASRSGTTNRCSPARGGPSTHSTYPNTLRRRVTLEVLVSVRTDILTGSSGATQTASSCSSPTVAYWNRVIPAWCRITQRPVSPDRANGPGLAPHVVWSSSSRRKIASPVGSLIGSLANGVSRFSRLLPDHVYAAPDSLTTVPNSALARTSDQ